jgi:pyrroline-5-carboxylate reductase
MRPEGTGEMAEGTRLRIGFLGAGRMATALARGWLTASLVRPGDLRASDPVPSARQSFATEVDCLAIAENAPVVEASDLLVLAVKPQSMPGLLPEIRPLLRSQLVVSIAAGISLSQLHKGLGEGCRLVRIMPNTPCLVGASASAYSPSTTATADDAALVDRLMNAVGKAYRVPEALLDAVTGLSGSGPAYVYVIVEALADGGVRAGLPRDVAQALAAQTVLGAAKMVLETGVHPAALKDMVASPGGTTIVGLQALERGGLRAALIDAVESAARRATELGKT